MSTNQTWEEIQANWKRERLEAIEAEPDPVRKAALIEGELRGEFFDDLMLGVFNVELARTLSAERGLPC